MSKEITITVAVSVVRAGDDYHIRVAYDGDQRLQFGPFKTVEMAHELADVIAASARSTIEFFLENQQWPLKVRA